MRTLNRGSIHPFIICIYPTLALYAHNITEVAFGDILRSFCISLLAMAVFYCIMLAILRNAEKAGLIASLICLLFSTFGAACSWLIDHNFVHLDILAAIWATILILGCWSIIRVIKGRPFRLTTIANVISVALLVFNLGLIAIYGVKRLLYPAAVVAKSNAAQPIIESGETLKPDIYYIILDGYIRPDVFSEIYGTKDDTLVDFLKDHGFYIAQSAHSNYAQTSLSVPTSLNYNYLEELIQFNQASQDWEPIRELIKTNRAGDFLKKRGYKLVSISTGFYWTENENVDEFIRPSGLFHINAFEKNLLSNSILFLFLDRFTPAMIRSDMLDRFEILANQGRTQGPKFVIAHFVIPHPPFLFDSQGNPVLTTGQNESVVIPRMLLGGDGSDFVGGRDVYLRGYREQLLFVNSKIVEVLRTILAESDAQPIIILQGDHGSGAYLNWASAEDTCMKERLSILNAYLLPGVPEQDLYPSISPVNSFRVIFNRYFGANFPLLPDNSYFSTRARPFDFINVDNRLNETCE